jgi:hypothetical protein
MSPVYSEARRPLGLEHKIHSRDKKNVREIVSDRVEGFDDYYPCLRKGCDLKHKNRRLHLYTQLHNNRRRHIKLKELLSLLRSERPLPLLKN